MEKDLSKRSKPRKRYVKQKCQCVEYWDSFMGEKGERSVCEIIFANIIVFTSVFLSAILPVFSLGLPILVLFYFQIGLWGFVYNKECCENFFYEDIFTPLKILIKSFCVSVIKLTLWAFGLVLLIVPGVIFMLNYCFTSLILFENPLLDVRSVLALSKELVKGYRLKILFFAFFSLATICIAVTLMFSIILLFDHFFVVPTAVYVTLVIFAAVLDFLTLALPMFEVILVDCYDDAKKKASISFQMPENF